VVERTAPRDPRKVHIPAPDAGSSARASAGAGAAAPKRSGVAPRPVAAANRRAAPPPPSAPRTATRRPWWRRRPRLRTLLLLLPVLLLVAGWLYATSVFNRIEKVPVASVLSSGGDGTNYLIVGSDTRDLGALEDAGLDPAGFMEGGGQRSDTLLLLRFEGGTARMMSIPRDLYLPIAGTGGSQKINAAYNGGPTRVIQTVQESLGLPVHHYMEVDFVSFASLVDALGGITIEFEHPAYDTNSGLQVDQAGQVELDGPQALAYVRSRNYVEIIDGTERRDPTADLGRIQRQQRFLTAVFSELGSSRNPLRLARAAGSATGGLRIDDRMGLLDAMRLAWRLRSLDPESVELPVDSASNAAGSVLLLREAEAQPVLDLMR
jgi:LCP family protein required for cell wall assembly